MTITYTTLFLETLQQLYLSQFSLTGGWECGCHKMAQKSVLADVSISHFQNTALHT